MAASLWDGDTFAGYRVVRRLGAGGMGTVYLAHDDDLDRPIALKLLSSALAEDTDVQARFLREARTAARLNHPNIVSVYARGVHDGQLYIAMQYIDGTDAASPISGGRQMPVARAVRIISETAAALDFAHLHGVLHRDVKPANILLSPSGSGQLERVLLADFGIAKALEDSAHQTRTGFVLGSFQYAAPEQFDPRITLDHRIDVYALGATFYHLLTGQLPFPGTTIAQLVSGHLNESPPRPSAYGVAIEFDRIISTALAKHREDRYSSCGELAADARAVLAGSSRPAPPTAAISSGPAEQTLHMTPRPVQMDWEPDPKPQSPPPPRAPRKDRRISPAALAIVVVLALAAILGWVLLSGGGIDEPNDDSVETLTRPPADDVALDVSAPISQPACDGTGIVVLGSAVTPGRYDAEIQQFLNAFPGAAYLRNDYTCPSLRQKSEAGNPIYAVYRLAGRTEREVCAAVHQLAETHSEGGSIRHPNRATLFRADVVGPPGQLPLLPGVAHRFDIELRVKL